MRAKVLLGVALSILVVVHSSCGAQLRPRVKVVKRPYQPQRLAPGEPPVVTAAVAPRRRTSVSSRSPVRPDPATPKDQHQHHGPKAEDLPEKEYKIYVPPQLKPGYYYNAHVERPGLIKIKGLNDDANVEKQKEVSSFEGIRSESTLGRAISKDVLEEGETDGRVFFDKDRYWRVSPKPTLKPGFYLNQQFQNKILPDVDKRVFASSKKESDNVVFRVDSRADTKYHEVTPTFVPESKKVVQVVSRVAPTVTPEVPEVDPEPETLYSYSVPHEFQRVNPSFSAFVPIPVAFASNQRSRTRGPVPQVVTQPIASTPTRSSRPNSQPAAQPKSKPTPQPTSRPVTPKAVPRPTSTVPPPRPAPAAGTSFSCEGLNSGYYPNEASNCKKYHVCNPIHFGSGKVINYKHDFTCSPGTTWDQSKLVCVAEHLAASCSQSVALAFDSAASS